jgi:hypothetical protein
MIRCTYYLSQWVPTGDHDAEEDTDEEKEGLVVVVTEDDATTEEISLEPLRAPDDYIPHVPTPANMRV